MAPLDLQHLSLTGLQTMEILLEIEKVAKRFPVPRTRALGNDEQVYQLLAISIELKSHFKTETFYCPWKGLNYSFGSWG